MGYKVGVDVGGTFTDFLLMDEEGNFEIFKSPSTPRDPSIAVINGLADMAARKGSTLEGFLGCVDRIVHGTTVTTNAVLTGNGARTALLTTAGFRDVLEMRRGYREERYNNRLPVAKPLVPRDLRLPIDERVDHAGNVIKPLDREQARAAIGKLASREIEALAVCFMHSYANNQNEASLTQLIEEDMPGAYLTVSSQLLSQVRLYDRISTTVLNSYVGPILRNYLQRLTEKLAKIGYTGVLLIMQSNGGVTSPSVAVRNAASTLLSGPAAGPVAGVVYSASQGCDSCITIDMGGTSFDVALVRDRKCLVSTDGWVGRYRLALPALDIHTIGAGGGSIGWIDEGGLLRMGPQSAGADPGPACYGRGGERAACSDADLLLGYLNPDYFLGGKMKLDVERASRAIERHIARPMGLDLMEAAAGMYQVINVNMANGIRQITVRRGIDPREYPLVVAGGAGPVHAGQIALELEIPLVIVPRESSIFCAGGMLLSDLKHDFVRTCVSLLSRTDLRDIRLILQGMVDEGHAVLLEEGVAAGDANFLCSAEMRYVGQYHEIPVQTPLEDLASPDGMQRLKDSFHAAHDALYGYSLKGTDRDIELINLRATAVGITEKPVFKEQAKMPGDSTRCLKGRRKVYLPSTRSLQDVNVYDGDSLAYGNEITGPAIVEQVNTTVFVPPEYDLFCDPLGSYIMRITQLSGKFG